LLPELRSQVSQRQEDHSGLWPLPPYVRKGDHAAILTMFFNGATTTTVLNMDQLEALAAVVASRW
jgi:hypothetical protein